MVVSSKSETVEMYSIDLYSKLCESRIEFYGCTTVRSYR